MNRSVTIRPSRGIVRTLALALSLPIVVGFVLALSFSHAPAAETAVVPSATQTATTSETGKPVNAPGETATEPESPSLVAARAAALADAPSASLPLKVLARTFKARDGSTELVVSLHVDTKGIRRAGTGDPDLTLYARVTRPGAAEAKPVEITDPESFTLFEEAGDEVAVYAFSIALPPGRCELRVAAREGADDGPSRLGSARTEIELPDYSGDSLRMSSLTCSWRTVTGPGVAGGGSVPEGTATAVDSFRFGAMRLIPRAQARLAAGEDFGFYYQVYGAKDDAATGKPLLDVAYSFEKKEAGAWKPLTRAPLALPGQREATLGYSLGSAMLAKFPAGDCRVVISVKDRIGGGETGGTLEFTLVR